LDAMARFCELWGSGVRVVVFESRVVASSICSVFSLKFTSSAHP
jgi:hypothetical protein